MASTSTVSPLRLKSTDCNFLSITQTDTNRNFISRCRFLCKFNQSAVCLTLNLSMTRHQTVNGYLWSSPVQHQRARRSLSNRCQSFAQTTQLNLRCAELRIDGNQRWLTISGRWLVLFNKVALVQRHTGREPHRRTCLNTQTTGHGNPVLV